MDDESGREKDEESEEEGTPPIAEPSEIQPVPGLTAPLDDVTEEEKEKKPTGVLPGAGPDEADELAERKQELQREGKPWGWEEEDGE